MERILLYDSKYGLMAWDASTPELEETAYLCLFRYLDHELECYQDMKDMESDVYRRAKKGEKAAAKKILMKRKSYEYETWQLLDIQPSDL